MMRCARGIVACSLVTLLLAAGGCDRGPESVPVEDTRTTTAKEILLRHADTGEPLGSEGMTIQQEIDRIHAEDPEKAQRLSEQLSALSSAQDPALVRQRAAAMAKEL